jgi:hypothetical protein
MQTKTTWMFMMVRSSKLDGIWHMMPLNEMTTMTNELSLVKSNTVDDLSLSW